VVACACFLLALAAAPAYPQVPPPTPPPPQGSGTWQISVISVTVVDPDSMRTRPQHQIIRVNLRIKYVGPAGDVMAVVPRVQDASGGTYRMLGNLATEDDAPFALMTWLMSGSHEGQTTLPLTSGQSIGEWGFFFEVPSTGLDQLSLNFGDVPPVRLRGK
jgi:hypothetical protein